MWIGQPGSGFATVPVDPTRTTAKPAVRLLVPPFQRFTDTLDVGVIAMANEEGTLINNFGIADVTFHFEGNSVAVDKPTWHTIMTPRGPRTYLGWWVRLRRPLITVGNALLYATARPRNAAMQSRVVGPWTFSLVNRVHDISLTVTPSKPAVPGKRFQTLDAAVAFAKADGWVNPLITITEPGTYSMTDALPDAYTRAGYCNITSNVPMSAGLPQVWIGAASETAGDVSMPDRRWKIRLFGNIGLDFRFMQEFTRRTTAGTFERHWFDGITITNTAPSGRNELWRGGRRFSSQPLRGAWLTECDISEIHDTANFSALIRGCTFRRTANDSLSGSTCIVQSTFDDHDSVFWNTNTAMFTVRYDGAAAVATLSRRGGRLGQANTDGIGMFRVSLDGVNYDFTVGDDSPTERGVAGRFFSNVVTWLNTIPGITAYFTGPQDRAAYASGITGGAAAVGWGFPSNSQGPLNIKGVTQTVFSQFDLHSDWYQHNSGTLENVVIWGNVVTKCPGQIVFLAPTGTSVMRDVFVVGNCFERPTFGAGNFSTIGRQTNTLTVSHLVFAHNSMATQSLRLWGNANQPPANSYNLIKNNALAGIFRSVSNAWPSLTIDGNHLQAGATDVAGATNTSFGGANSREFYVNVDAGDFSPAAPLLNNLKAPAIPFDRNGKSHEPNMPTGAVG